MQIQSSQKSFGGELQIWQHNSEVTKTPMRFAVYEPKKKETPRGALLWLSGLTCNEHNFVTKSGALEYLAHKNILLVCPDTSPRGLKLAGEHDSYDFGSGAGFYVNATTPGYGEHYRMYDYVVKELHDLLISNFQFHHDKLAISGHSMGGHGALIIGLKNPTKFKSVSAFSPIVNPMRAPWGQKAFHGYLGDDQVKWKEWDACELILAGKTRSDTILIDQGSNDEYLEKELLTKNFMEACEVKNQLLNCRFQDGYDHSYYFISTFIKQHIDFHFA